MAYWVKLAYARGEPQFEFQDDPQSKKYFGLSMGKPVDSIDVPTTADETKGRKKLADIFSMPGLNAVSSRFRDLVEGLEPGVHQFFPLKLFYKNGSRVEEDYFVFNCTVSFDCLLTAQSEVTWYGLDDPNECPRVRVGWRDRIVLSRPAIAGRHVWCPLKIRHAGIYVSDEMYAQMSEMEMKYFDSCECDEVKYSWIPEENIGPILEYENQYHDRL